MAVRDQLFNDARVPWSEYHYYDPKTVGLDFDGMICDIKAALEGSFVLLHGCARNPTSIDPTPEQWEKIADVIQEKNHIPFFDVAYQSGFLQDCNWFCIRIENALNVLPSNSHSLACAATLTWVRGQRYTQTSKIMPAGIVAGISALMTGFYLYKIATGEFLKARCLMNCKVALILEHKCEQLQQMADDPMNQVPHDRTCGAYSSSHQCSWRI